MSPPVPLHVSDAMTAEERLRLEAALDDYNIDQTGLSDARLLSVVARSPDGKFLGGLQGYTWGGYCEIRTIFIVAAQRRRGLGRQMLAAAEAEAIRRGCGQVILSTHGFQAPGFYEGLGYNSLAQIPDCPRGSSFLLMGKRLDRDCN